MDAAIAGAFIMTVTMPDAASLGGAGAALHYDAEGRHITAFVGRETAGAAIDPSWLEPEEGETARPIDGGQAVGAPSLLPMLGALHKVGGRLSWAKLAQEAEVLARTGAPLTRDAAKALSRLYFPHFSGADEIFGTSGEGAAPAGTIIRNPMLANVFYAIGRDGAGVLSGGIAGHSIKRLIADTRRRPATLTLDELGGAVPTVAPPVCVALARSALCAPPAPTLGPFVLETTALFEAAAPANPTGLDWANILAQAHRAAMADARYYLGDPLKFPDMTPTLLEPEAIVRRAHAIQADQDRGLPGAMRLRGTPIGMASGAPASRHIPTASIVVVDRHGSAVALSLTLTKPFGAGLAARGVLLNAANSAFDRSLGHPGIVRANAVRPGARPRLDLAPIMALDGERRLILVAAGSGGSDAPAFLAEVAIATLKFGMSAEAAVAAPNVASSHRATRLEIRSPAERLENGLRDIGHQTEITALPSGLVVASKGAVGFEAAADPRGEGAAKAKPPATWRALDLPKRGS